LRPADVEILPDETGRPFVGGLWARGVPRPPLVSISHVEAAAIAVAGDGEELSGVGIDLERCGRMTPAMERVAFSDDEREMLRAFEGDEREAWSVRFWCAKEAWAKAHGCTVGPASRAVTVKGIHPERGTVLLRHSPPGQDDVTFTTSTSVDGKWVVATCLVEHAARAAGEIR